MVMVSFCLHYACSKMPLAPPTFSSLLKLIRVHCVLCLTLPTIIDFLLSEVRLDALAVFTSLPGSSILSQNAFKMRFLPYSFPFQSCCLLISCGLLLCYQQQFQRDPYTNLYDSITQFSTIMDIIIL